MRRSLPKLAILLGAGLSAFAQPSRLTLTQTGISDGFHLTSFVTGLTGPTGFTGPTSSIGPLGVAVASTGNVIVNSSFDRRNYVFPDTNGQTPGNAISSTPFFGFESAYTVAGGSVWGSGGSFGSNPGALIRFNNDGTINRVFSLTGLFLTNGMATCPNGHIIGVGVNQSNLTSGSTSSLYDIDVSGSTPGFRLITTISDVADGVTVTPDGTTAYVALSSSVAGYNIATGALVFGPVAVSGGPDGVGVITTSNPANPLNGQIVVNTNAGLLILIDPKTGGTPMVIAIGGTRGDYVAPDTSGGPFAGSLFVTQSTEIFRLDCGSGCAISATFPPVSLSGMCPATPIPLNVPFSLPVTASGGSGSYRFSLSGNASWLGLSATSGTADSTGKFVVSVTGTPPAPGPYSFIVTLTDATGTLPPATFSCSVTVLPPLSLTGACPSTAIPLGRPFSLPLTASGGNGSYRFSLSQNPPSPGWLGLSATSGTADSTGRFVVNVIGTPPAPGIYSFTVTMTDTAGTMPPVMFTCPVTVLSGLSITGTCPASSVPFGVPISVPFGASGGSGTYTWTLSGNPSFLALSASGASATVAGTPNVGAPFSFTLTLSDSSGTPPVSRTCGPTNVGPPLSISGTCPAASIPFGVPISIPFGASGGSGNYTWALSGNPSFLGLTASGASATVAGTPNVSAPFSFTLTLSDSSGTPPVSRTCGPTNVGPPLSISGTCPAASIPFGVPISVPFGASGGSGNYTWVLSGNPSFLGLTASGASATVAGTPNVSAPFSFTLTLSDSSGTPPVSRTCGPTNVGPPLSISGTCPAASIPFGVPISVPFGASGGSGNYTWALSGNPSFLALNATGASATVAGTPNVSAPFSFTLTLSDSSGTPPVSRTCGPTNVGPPLSISGTCPAASIPFGVPISVPFGASGGSGNYTWVLSGNPSFLGLTASGASATVAGTPNVSAPFSFTLTLSDNSGTPPVSRTCGPTNVGNPLSISGTCPAASIPFGVPISVPFTASGGIGTYSWALSGNPSFLGLNASGASANVAGTPNASGPFSFTVTLTDTAGTPAATRTCGPTIVGPPLSISGTCPAASIPFGVNISVPFTASGGIGTYTWSLSGNPSFLGLTASGASAAVAGTPNASGPFSFTLTLIDSSGTPAVSRTCGPTNVGTPLSITGTCPAASIPFGVPISVPFSASGGLGNYTWSLTANPSFLGLTPNGAMATVAGTPNASGPFSFTVTLTDSAGTAATSRNCGPTNVGMPLSISGTCPAASNAFGSAISVPFTASGGLGNYTWALTSNPSLLSLASNGASATVAGTASVSGPLSFTLTLNDSAGTPAVSRNCGPITIFKPLSLNGACASARAASPYSIALIASGGNGMYSFSFTGPSWLVLSAATGVAGPGGFFNNGLTGFPPGIGTYPVSVTLTDTGGSTPTTFSCSATINPAPLVITSGCPTSPLVVGTAFSEFLTANGSLPPYTWAISGGTLPAGLSLVGNTISGTPAGPPGISNFNIVVSTDEQTTQISCSLSVTGQGLQITSGCPAATGTVGVPYGPFGLTATGGNPSSYAFSIINGGLPAGVGISGNTITGTPTAVGTSNFSIQVASGTQTSTAGPCSVAIAPSLALNVSCPTTAQAGSPLSAAFSATGGQTPYSFSLSGQPSWLSLGTGAVSGVPPAEAAGTTASFTVTVTDATKTSKSQSCPAFPITPPAPAIVGACPATTQTAGTTLNIPLSVSGGQAPFNWTYDNGDPDLALASPSGQTNTLSGTLTRQGSFTFSVGLAGAAAPLTCSITVGPPALQITASPTCPTTPVPFGTKFSTTLTATGGNGTYSWSVSPNPPFSLTPATGASTTVSATLSTAGASSFTATLSDSSNTTPAMYNCAFTVATPVTPPTTITTGPLPTSLSPLPITLNFASPVVADLTGILTLSFTSKAANPVDNPLVSFSTCGTATNCGTAPIRTYQFTVPAGTTSLPLNVMVQVGRVYGTIQLQLTSLMLGNQSVLPSPAPSVSLDVPKLAPVISAMAITNSNSSGFTVQITGYSTPRDISDPVMLTFTAASGATIEGSPLSYSVSSIISSFFKNGSDSMFTLNLPVSVNGDITAITSVTVTLTNSAGTTTMTHSVP